MELNLEDIAEGISETNMKARMTESKKKHDIDLSDWDTIEEDSKKRMKLKDVVAVMGDVSTNSISSSRYGGPSYSSHGYCRHGSFLDNFGSVLNYLWFRGRVSMSRVCREWCKRVYHRSGWSDSSLYCSNEEQNWLILNIRYKSALCMEKQQLDTVDDKESCNILPIFYKVDNLFSRVKFLSLNDVGTLDLSHFSNLEKLQISKGNLNSNSLWCVWTLSEIRACCNLQTLLLCGGILKIGHCPAGGLTIFSKLRYLRCNWENGKYFPVMGTALFPSLTELEFSFCEKHNYYVGGGTRVGIETGWSKHAPEVEKLIFASHPQSMCCSAMFPKLKELRFLRFLKRLAPSTIQKFCLTNGQDACSSILEKVEFDLTNSITSVQTVDLMMEVLDDFFTVFRRMPSLKSLKILCDYDDFDLVKDFGRRDLQFDFNLVLFSENSWSYIFQHEIYINELQMLASAFWTEVEFQQFQQVWQEVQEKISRQECAPLVIKSIKHESK